MNLHQKKSTLRKTIDFTQNTAFHGVKYITDGNNFFRKNGVDPLRISFCDCSRITRTFELGLYDKFANEQGNLCEFYQTDKDDFDWVKQIGPTGTFDTGPIEDHTTGRGYYIYVEATNRERGEVRLDTIQIHF
ncbi:DgyrCDS14687 [Dimorphilus gyrociliatus]|uniref:DgyrCDS14687 n=1 Tax=Dimorphilus gyrociliatus TaxID=2664684 RepID=A0A7I8WEW7_9ANNE|nr:DgyrCDS14687 [Dimorphilus gyrociliatus]